MKKTYIIPTSMTVVFGTTSMMARSKESVPIYDDDELEDLNDPSLDLLTKESKSIWDNEW